MKTIVKVLCVLMCLLMALSVLSACKKKDEPNPSDTTDNPVGPVDPVDPENPDNPDDPNPGGQGGSTDPVVDPIDPSGDNDLLDDQMRAKYPGMKVTGIASAEDLLALAYIVNSSANIREMTEDTVYYLAGDIDLNPYWVAETTLDSEVYPPFEPAEPFEGFQEFYGIFDGNGHTLSGVYLMSDEVISYDSIGFFWDLYGSVKDLTLENCFVCGKTESGDTYTNVSIGALAGRLLGEGSQIENVSVKSTYVLFEGDKSPDMGGVIGTIEAEDCVLRSVFFEGQVILASSNEGYPSPAEDVVMAQIVGSAEDNTLLLEDCLAGGLLFGVEPEDENKNFCAEGDAYVTLKSCRVETPIIEEDPEGIISIRTKKDLLGLDPNQNYAGITIRLMNDINLNPGWIANSVQYETLEVPSVYWNGIPEFAGTFDGQGYTISGLCRIVNLDKENSSAGGLVDLLLEGAVIKNLTIENSAILAYKTSDGLINGVLLGGAVARAEKNTTIQNVVLGMDIWTFGSVKGSFGGIQPYEPTPNLLKTENVVYTGEIGNIDLANLSKVIAYFDPYSEVSGFDEEIFLISNADELMAVMELAQDGEDFAGKTIRLTANIDLNPGIKTVATINPGTNRLELPNQNQIANKWVAIPTFRGMFDGNGYAISGLYTWKNAKSENNGDYGGFINSAEDGAIIKNLIIRDSIFVLNNTGDGAWGSRSMHAGGLVGRVEKAPDVESTFALTLSCVYVDMDVIFLCTNHGSVGGILGFAVRHGNDYTSSYRLVDVVFAGRIINSDYTLKVPYTSPKDQFSMSQIVSDTNWGSKHEARNVLAAGEIISGNLSGESSINPVFGAKTYSGVKCTNVVSGRYTVSPKGAFNPSKSNDTAPFNGASWSYNHDLGFYMPIVVSKMIADNDLSDTINTDLVNRGFFVSADPNPDEIHVSTAQELIKLAQSGKNFEGSTIYLDADIDLNPGWSAKTSIDEDGKVVFPKEPKVTWTAFKEFKGTINGQGHTISGLYSKRTVKGNEGNYGGLIDYQSDGRILNLAIVNSIHIVVSSGDGEKKIHIGGLAADINKVTIKSGDANKDPYALGNSENYGFILENFFTDMEVWLVSPNHAVVGGLIGMVNAKYNIQRTVFAGKVGNTDKMDGNGAAFNSIKNVHLGQFIGCGNYHSGVYIEDSLAVGSIITGTKGTDAQYIHTYVGSDDKGSRGRTSTILYAEAPSESWVRSEGGFYVPQSVVDFVKDYRPAMVIDGDHTLTGLTLQHKDKLDDSLTVTASLKIPDDVTVIADSAFEGCYFLESVTLPSGLTEIGEKAFFNCTEISSTALPSSLSSIGDNAFANCAKLTPTAVDDDGNAKYLGNESDPYILLLRATSTTISSCTIHENTRFINDAAFAGCSNLTAIKIPSSVTGIGANAFEGCTGLTAIETPESVNHLGAYAFKDCTGLTAMEISVGVSSIGQGLFYGCVKLSSLTVAPKNAVYEADGNCVIEKSTKTLVAGCKSSVIPGDGSVTSIGIGAFSGCYGLEASYEIPAGVESIEESAFSDCKALTEVTIPYTVTSIGKNAFSGCEKLTKAIYTSTEANWGGVSKTSADWEEISIEYTLAKENIIHVSTADELLDLAQSGENFKWKVIYLDNDIDLNPGWSAAVSIVDGKLVLPDEPDVIWTAFTDFQGSIDGQGHSISGLYSNRSVSKNKGAYGGLFDVVRDGVVVENLMIKNSIHIVQNMESGSYGTTNIHIGGLAAECDKTANSGRPAFALTVSNVYVDMDVVFLCSEQSTLGGLLGFAVRYENQGYTSQYQMRDTVFAGRIVNTNSEMIVPYTSPENKQFTMSQIVANVNWGSQHVLTNVLAAGQIISGNLRDSGVNPIHGTKDNTGKSVKATDVIDGWYTTLPTAAFKPSNRKYEASFDGNGWTRLKDGFYVPQGVANLLKDYVATFVIVDGTLNRITLQPKSASGVVPVSNVGTSITIPKGVTSIAAFAFEGHYDLESIIIPEGVTSIGESAFAGLSNLKSVVFPSTLTTIGKEAFKDCESLVSITLPKNLTTVGESAFAGSSIVKLILPASLTTIGDSAFAGMENLKSVAIPEGVTTIGKSAFAELPNLQSISFPKSLTEIGAGAFYDCTALSSLTYPGTKDEWNAIKMKGAWEEQESAKVTCSDGASCINHILDEGVVTKEMTCLEHGNRMHTCSVCGSHVNEQITSPLDHKWVSIESDSPATCTAAGYSASVECLYCHEILEASQPIPALGHNWGEDNKCKRCGAKKPSEGLEYVYNADDNTCYVKSIGTYTNFDNVAIPSKTSYDGNEYTVTAIGDFAFADEQGRKIKSIQIPPTVTSIGTGAFANCSALEIKVETVMGGNPVFTSTTDGIFKDDGATLVRFSATKATYKLPKNLEKIEDYAFSGCSKLSSFSITGTSSPFKVTNGSLYTKDGTTLVRATVSAQTLAIAASTKTIAPHALVVGSTVIALQNKSSTLNLSNMHDDDRAILESVYQNGTVTMPVNVLANYPQAHAEKIKALTVNPTSSVKTVKQKDLANYTALTTVILENGGSSFTSIQENAFSKCTNLKTVTIPNTVTTVATDAFAGCSKIEEATIPASAIASISQSAALKTVEIISGTTAITIGAKAFKDCTNLVKVTLPSTPKSIQIGAEAFSGCTSLTEVNLPDNLTSIGDSAFAGTAITSVSIPKNVVKIGDYAFSGCTALKKVTISGENVTIGEDAFKDCPIEEASIPASAIASIPQGALKTLKITSGTSIGAEAFKDCTTLEEVTIPSTVEEIGDYAFSGCTALKKVTISGSNVTIGEDAFAGCSKIEEVTIPASAIASIPQGALKTLKITSGTSIGAEAFKDCTTLEEVTIPSTVEEIGDYAFSGCTALKKVTISGESVTFGEDAFKDCPIEEASIPASAIASISQSAALKTVEIMSGTSIGAEAFKDCTTLEEVTIPSTVEEIGDYAFSGCTALKKVTISGENVTIGEDAFKDCPIEEASIPASAIASIPQGALKKVTITSGTSIGAEAFKDCTTLEEVTIPSTVEEIGDSAFENCTNLATVTTSAVNNLKHVGTDAFKGTKVEETAPTGSED